jgi:hypothetical protein
MPRAWMRVWGMDEMTAEHRERRTQSVKVSDKLIALAVEEAAIMAARSPGRSSIG